MRQIINMDDNKKGTKYMGEIRGYNVMECRRVKFDNYNINSNMIDLLKNYKELHNRSGYVGSVRF